MADVFLTENYEDVSEECNENTIDDLSGPLKDNSDMTLKQDVSDSELFTADDLLVNPDDLLPPVVKLEKYANSDIVFNRQVVARNLLETLRLVHENSDDVARVINVLGSISEDYDPSVRTELMVQLPHIAAFCKDVKLNKIIAQYLVPMLLSYLRDENNLVRKSSHSALLSVIEQGLVDFSTQTEKIWPLVLHMTDSVNSEDIRTESIVLMSKLVVLVGAEEQFFERLFALCADRSNNVRKACASTFGEICTTVGREVTEELLLPKFFTLCEDSAWCVRKACAENFMPVSCIVSREIRCKELSSLYMILLSDQSRWVRVTAYQALGPFISTFAEPDKTGLYYSKDGVLTIVDSPTPIAETSEQSMCCDDEANCNGDLSQYNCNEDSHSSFDRTTSSKSCDNVVPLNCLATSCSPSDVPSISCQVGNYCTVIEVSSQTSVTESTDIIKSESITNSIEDSLQQPEQPQSINSDVSLTEVDSSQAEINGYKVNRLNQSGEEFDKLWYEAAKMCEDCGTGDLCGKDLSEEPVVNNKVGNNNVEMTHSHSVTSEDKQISWKSMTVNGVNFGRSIPLLGPIAEVINCNNSSLDQSILNNLLKETGALSNLHSHSTDDESVQCDTSDINMSPQDSDCTDENTDVKTENEVLNPFSDKPVDNESAFNNFQYWRDPVPIIEMDEEFTFYLDNCIGHVKQNTVNPGPNSYMQNSITAKRRIGKPYIICRPKQTLHHPVMKTEESRDILKINSIPENKGEPPPSTKPFTVHDQDIVPPELLLQYVSMIDSAWAQTIDAEIARHCAYSLPAVALTLGRNYWPCLKETFDALTSDLQGFIMMWKVRRTVASAMHQLAVILGPDITSKDLLPVFSRFINDLDEVRVGILQHLYDFLKILRPQERVQFLPSLPEFLISNNDADINEKNWRFRLILAEQLVCTADLYEPQHVRDHLVPLCLTLIKDKVCEVRLAAVRVMAAIMKRMSQSPTQTLTKAVFNELTEKFVHARKWLHRQLYVYVCQELIIENSLTADQFAEDALPQLLFLCWDRIPNVRLAIARCLVTVMWPLDTYSSPDSPHRELLLETIHTLQSDIDADVRFYANMVSTHDCSCLQNGEFSNVSDPFV